MIQAKHADPLGGCVFFIIQKEAMQIAKSRMKDSYKVLSAVVLSVLTVFGVQYGLINYFASPDNAKAQSSGGVSVYPGMHITNNYADNLTSSTTRNDSAAYTLPFENFFSFIDNKRVPTLIDVNGDGLTDMIYSYVYVWGEESIGQRDGTQWVVLNVGDGYELVYYCKVANQRNASNQIINGAYEYWGDCAA